MTECSTTTRRARALGVPLCLALAAIVAACDRRAPRAPADAVPDTGGAPGALIADALDVTTIDSTGLGGVPLCAPLGDVRTAFPHALDTVAYCAEDGCDTPYPARLALTRGGDTLLFESAPDSEQIDRDGRPRVHFAWTRSPRIRGPLGVHAGMTVGQVLATGETIELDTSEVVFGPSGDGGAADTIRLGPNVLRLTLRRQGLVAEIQDSVERDFTRRLVPGRPAREALDTATRIALLGVLRNECR